MLRWSRLRIWLAASAGIGLLSWTVVAGRARGGEGTQVAPWRQGLPGRAATGGVFFPPELYRRHPVGAALPVIAPTPAVVAGSILSAEVLLAIGDRDRLAGVHELAADPRYSNVAAIASGLRRVGADPEGLLAVRPDLVVTDAFTRVETQRLLERAGVAVVRTHAFADFDDVADNLRLIGWAVGRAAAAEALVQAMGQRLAAVQAAAPGVRGWRVMTLNGALDTLGRGALVDAVITATGATNVAAEHGVGPYRKLDIEAVLAWRPDALVLAQEPGAAEGTPAWIQQTPGLDRLPCVQKRRFVFVPAALLGATSHHVVGAAERIQAQLAAWGRP